MTMRQVIPPSGAKPSRIKEVLDRAANGSNHIATAVKLALQTVQRMQAAETTATRLDEIAQDLGDQRAGRILALSSGDEPLDADGIGVFFSSVGEDFPEGTFNIGGVNNGDLQFGLDAESGKALFGGGNVINDALGSTYYGTTAGQVYLSFRQIVSAADHFLGSLTSYFNGTSDAYTFIVGHAAGSHPWARHTVILYASDQDNANLRYTNISVSSADDIVSYSERLYFIVGHPENTTAMTAALAAGGSVDSGDHYYAVTFVDGYGETGLDSGGVSAVVTTGGGNNTVNLSAIPVGKDNVTARKIYRTTADNASDWKLLTTISDNTTTTYSDTTADASLGARPPDYNTTGGLVFDKNPTQYYNGVQLNPEPRLWRPPAPVAALVATATGNIANGTYTYRVAYVDAGGNEILSDASNSVVVDASHKQVTVKITPGPYSTSGRYLYRNTSTSSEWVKLVWIGDNTTYSYTDNLADGSMVGGTAYLDGFVRRPLFPNHAFWMADQMEESTALTWTLDTGQYFNMVWTQTTASDGDWWKMGVYLDAGTYTLTIVGETNTGHGKLDGWLDGTSIFSAVDWYAAAATKNVVRTYTVTVADPGWHLLYFRVNGKNASSSGYRMRFTAFWMDMDED